jgi:glycosyltransferase involved in cell wall biosynthesis
MRESLARSSAHDKVIRSNNRETAKPLHIAVDARYIRLGFHDGISRFSAHLIAELADLVNDRDDLRLTVLVSNEAQRKRIPFDGSLATFMISPPTSIKEPFVASQVNRLKPDVVFSPMQTMGTWGRRYRAVLTIHDLIYYRHRTPPREFNVVVRALWRAYHLSWWPQRLLLRGADAIVAVSRTTRELIKQNHLTRRPIFVVPNAADRVLSRVPPRSGRTKKLIYMGSFMPYKNVLTLLKASEFLPEWELHLMSRIGPTERTRLLALAPRARAVFHDGCTDEEYADALRSAIALVTASRDEGFGIPVVEAMAYGTPVVVSDIPIFREIGGDAALFASPDSPEDFAARVHELSDPREWSRRSELVKLQSQQFDWARSARLLLDVLCEVGRTEP